MTTFEQSVSTSLELFRRHEVMTRSEFVRESGLSRSAVNQRIDVLLSADLILSEHGEVQTKGRPADRFTFNATKGLVLAADLGVEAARVGICDLSGNIQRESTMDINIVDDPEAVMQQLIKEFDLLMEETGVSVAEILGVGVGVPAPVKIHAGFTVNPPIMPMWNRFDVPASLARHYSVPVILEKDANIMAYGEARLRFPDVENLLMVKVGTGIGSGFVLNGQLFRGSDGAAGDIGHTLVESLQPDDSLPLCKCGNRGCLEAYAGGWAILRDLQDSGNPVYEHADLVQLINSGDPAALEAIRRAGRLIGSAIATAINLTNPRVVVVGGRLATAGGDHLFAGIREMVYRRSLPLATSNLRIERSTLFPQSGLVGLAHLVADSVLAPDRIGALLNGGANTAPAPTGGG